jgi:hypothetical protein
VKLWLVLIISTVIAAISVTFVGRYSCASEWQGYKTVASSLTNVWAVILGVSMPTMPRTPSFRSVFLPGCVPLWSLAQCSRHFSQHTLLALATKTPIRNLDELFASGIKLFYPQGYNYIFEIGDQTEASNVRKCRLNGPSYDDCLNWSK